MFFPFLSWTVVSFRAMNSLFTTQNKEYAMIFKEKSLGQREVNVNDFELKIVDSNGVKYIS